MINIKLLFVYICILALSIFLLIKNKKNRYIPYVILILIILFSLLHIYYNYCNKLDIYTFDSGIKGPVFVAVGGTHGNEPAGYYALTKIKNFFEDGTLTLKKGKVIIIPCLNKCGTQLGVRWLPQELFHLRLFNSDLNRNYPKDKNEEGSCPLSTEIINIIKSADFVLDLHEGFSYQRINKDSMGNGIYPGNTKLAKTIASTLAEKINELFEDDEENKKFDSIEGWPNVEGSLRNFCDTNKNIRNSDINYILVETAGQDDIEPIEKRVEIDILLTIDYLNDDHIDMI